MLLPLCTSILDQGQIRPMTSQDRKTIIQYNTQFADQAMRVLGFAYKDITHYSEEDKENCESDLVFV